AGAAGRSIRRPRAAATPARRAPGRASRAEFLWLGCSWVHCDADDLGSETHRGAIDDAAGELSAGRIDVVAARAPNGRQHALPDELVAEALDLMRGRAPVARAGKGIERDQVHLGRMALEPLRERARLRGRVVHAIQHHVLERDAAAVLFVEVVPAGVQE